MKHVVALALFLATPFALAQRTGGSFGASAWGSRPVATRPPPVRPRPAPPPPRVGVVVRPPLPRPVVASPRPLMRVRLAPSRPLAPLPRRPVPASAPAEGWADDAHKAPAGDVACHARPGALGSCSRALVLALALLVLAARPRKAPPQ